MLLIYGIIENRHLAGMLLYSLLLIAHLAASLYGEYRCDFRLGLEEDYVDCIKASLVEDSAVSTRGNVYFSAELTRCSYGRTEASAHGRCTVITRSMHPLSCEERIVASGHFISPGVFFAESVATVPSRFSALGRLHLAFVADISRRMGNTGSAGLARMLLLGRSDADDMPLKDAAKAAGCSHVLALSGMHLSILAKNAERITSPLFRQGSRKKKILPVIIVIFFTFIAGPRPSLVRSAVMYLLSTAATLLYITPPPALLLFLSSLIQVVLFPFQQSTTAFLLSYAALAGLFTVQGFILTSLTPLMPAPLSSALSSSVSALVFSVPFSIHFFGFWTPLSVILSAPAGLLAGFSMLTGLLLAMLGPVAPAAKLSELSYLSMKALFAAGGKIRAECGFTGYFILLATMLTVTVSLRYALSRCRKKVRRSFNVDI